MIDWIGIALSILKAAKKEDLEVDSKYIVIKPRILSDDNYLRGVAMLRGVLTFIPPAAIAAPILGLGAIGFKIWKKIALNTEYDRLEYPPVDPNMLRLSIAMDTELKKHYGHLILGRNWNEAAINELEPIFNDFQFITDAELLQTKYPHISGEYIAQKTTINRDTLKTNLTHIEQGLIQASHSAEVETNIREAFELVKEIFPVMNDWALFNSDGFDDIIEIIDTIF